MDDIGGWRKKFIENDTGGMGEGTRLIEREIPLHIFV
jgi:hypothetical protein